MPEFRERRQLAHDVGAQLGRTNLVQRSASLADEDRHVEQIGLGEWPNIEILQADTLVPNWTCSLSMGRDDMASRYCGRSESSESSERALVGRMNRYERDGERRMYNRDAGRARQETARSS